MLTSSCLFIFNVWVFMTSKGTVYNPIRAEFNVSWDAALPDESPNTKAV